MMVRRALKKSSVSLHNVNGASLPVLFYHSPHWSIAFHHQFTFFWPGCDLCTVAPVAYYLGGILALRTHCVLLLDYVPPRRAPRHTPWKRP